MRTNLFNDELVSWNNLAKVVASVVLLGVAVWALSRLGGDLRYIWAGLIGTCLGMTEILGRYTDSPVAAIKTPGAVIYILVNTAASFIALYLLLQLAPDSVVNPINQVLLAGLGAMTFLRSAFFKVKAGAEDIAIRPAIILDTLQKFADAQVDRARAQERAARISEVLQSLPLTQAGVDLPRLCFALMQNLTIDVRQRVLDDITLVVTDTKRSEPVKVLEIGLVLWSRVGIGTVMGAVTLLKKQPSGPAGITLTHDIVPPPPHGTPADLLPEITAQLAQDRQAGG